MSALTQTPRAPRPGGSTHIALPPAWRAWIESDPAVRRVGGGGRVGLISYEFAPAGGSGVQRPARLATYLPELGWQVEVFTAAHDRFPWRDPSLLGRLESRCCIHRVKGLEPACLARAAAALAGGLISEERARWLEERLYWRMIRLAAALGLGHGERWWVPAATAAVLRIHRRRPLDAIISTGPPHFTHQVALRVRRLTGLPWLADVRDPLVSDFSRSPAAEAATRDLRRLERMILRHAAAVATTCPALAADLRARYPHRPPHSIQSITNGFDREDLRAALLNNLELPADQADRTAGGDSRGARCENGFPHQRRFSHPHQYCGTGFHPVKQQLEPGGTDKGSFLTASRTADECLLVAAGSLYGRREIDRLVGPLQAVLDRHPEWRGRVRLVLAGGIDTRQQRRWERQRPEWLTLAGYLDHRAALRLAASADCAIVMVPDCAHGRLSIPGKTFELIALPVHVLGLAPEMGDSAQILKEAGASTIVPLESQAAVAEAFERIVAAHFAGRLARERDWSALDGYDRRMIAARFADCLSAACGRDQP